MAVMHKMVIIAMGIDGKKISPKDENTSPIVAKLWMIERCRIIRVLYT